VLQRVAACCSLLQCAVVHSNHLHICPLEREIDRFFLCCVCVCVIVRKKERQNFPPLKRERERYNDILEREIEVQSP